MENELIGKTLTGMKIAKDKKALLFEVGSENIIARTDGDCCSNSWVESVELPALGFPAKVLSVEDLKMPDLGSPDEHEVIAYYGLKITTDKGEIVIDYRNESNGYYGGNLVWRDDYFYGGVWGQNVSNEDWQAIRE